MLAKVGYSVRIAVLTAFAGAIASLLAPVASAIQVGPIQSVVWDTGAGGNGHTYLFVPLAYTTSWSAANAQADTISLPDGTEAYLATVTSEEESAFIKAQVLPNDWANDFSAVWIAPDDGYMLVNGEGSTNTPGPDYYQWKPTPEHWDYEKWRGENGPDDEGSLEKRFLAHSNENGSDDCDHGGPAPLPTPKVLGMIVEFDTVPVPEPTMALLSAFGIALLGLLRRHS